MSIDNPNSVPESKYQTRIANEFTEARFQAVVIAEAERQGYRVYHTHDSRRSQAGYPDLHMVNVQQGRSIFRELKKMTGKVSAAQKNWLEDLRAIGLDADVWRPIQWVNGTISEYLSLGAINLTRHEPLTAAQWSAMTNSSLPFALNGPTVTKDTPPTYATTAEAQDVIRHLEAHHDMTLIPWQKAALADAMFKRRITITLHSTRAELKQALNRINPNR